MNLLPFGLGVDSGIGTKQGIPRLMDSVVFVDVIGLGDGVLK